MHFSLRVGSGIPPGPHGGHGLSALRAPSSLVALALIAWCGLACDGRDRGAHGRLRGDAGSDSRDADTDARNMAGGGAAESLDGGSGAAEPYVAPACLSCGDGR
jgi:hypothetical protein